MVGYAQLIEGIIGDDERRGVFLEGLKSLANLTPDQRLKFHATLIGNISIFENNLNLFRSGVLPSDQIAVYEHDVVSLLNSPGASMWWDFVKDHYFSASLKEHIDGILDSTRSNVPPLSDALGLLLRLGEPSPEEA